MGNEYGPSPLQELYRRWCEQSDRLKEILPIKKLLASPLNVIYQSVEKKEEENDRGKIWEPGSI